MKIEGLEKEIRTWIVKHALDGRDDPSLERTTRLDKTGVVDSMAVTALLAHVEDVYKVTVAPSWRTPEKIGTIEQMAQVIMKLQR